MNSILNIKKGPNMEILKFKGPNGLSLKIIRTILKKYKNFKRPK
jgi:hypothetical protein